MATGDERSTWCGIGRRAADSPSTARAGPPQDDAYSSNPFDGDDEDLPEDLPEVAQQSPTEPREDAGEMLPPTTLLGPNNPSTVMLAYRRRGDMKSGGNTGSRRHAKFVRKHKRRAHARRGAFAVLSLISVVTLLSASVGSGCGASDCTHLWYYRQDVEIALAVSIGVLQFLMFLFANAYPVATLGLVPLNAVLTGFALRHVRLFAEMGILHRSTTVITLVHLLAFQVFAAVMSSLLVRKSSRLNIPFFSSAAGCKKILRIRRGTDAHPRTSLCRKLRAWQRQRPRAAVVSSGPGAPPPPRQRQRQHAVALRAIPMRNVAVLAFVMATVLVVACFVIYQHTRVASDLAIEARLLNVTWVQEERLMHATISTPVIWRYIVAVLMSGNAAVVDSYFIHRALSMPGALRRKSGSYWRVAVEIYCCRVVYMLFLPIAVLSVYLVSLETQSSGDGDGDGGGGGGGGREVALTMAAPRSA